MKRLKRCIYFFIYTLICSLSFSFEKLNVTLEYNPNTEIKGFMRYNTENDLDNDGKKEKIDVYSKEIKNGVETYLNIYTLEENTYKFKYQIYVYSNKSILSLEEFRNKLQEIKNHYSKISSNVSKNEIRYIEIHGDNVSENLSINLKYNKNAVEGLNTFVFIKKPTALKEWINGLGSTVEYLEFKSKPKLIFTIESNENQSNSIWYYVKTDKSNYGFLSSNSSEKRSFDWYRIYKNIEKINLFINNAHQNNKPIYVITAYVPLGKDFYSKADKFGNRANQSIRAYYEPNVNSEYINIPDQSIFSILEIKDDFIKIGNPFYGGPYYIKNNPKTYTKTDVNSAVNRFIAVDTKSQLEVAVEKNKTTNKFEVITYSFVTTGKDNGYSSYATPHGAFLVAHTRTFMMFTRKHTGDMASVPKRLRAGNGLIVAGEAPYAVRFSGGAYLHGLPGPLGASTASKQSVSNKIGTFNESHKCVRHYDDQIKFIFEWLSVENYDKEDMEIKLKENTIVFVI